MQDARLGDRYLLCSDGLSAVVGMSDLRRALAGPGNPQQVVDQLVAVVRSAGAPDNVTCVVADVGSADVVSADVGSAD